MPEERHWFLYTSEGVKGPYTLLELKNWKKQKFLDGTCYLWKEGLKDWTLFQNILSPPPLPEKNPKGIPQEPLAPKKKKRKKVKIQIAFPFVKISLILKILILVICLHFSLKTMEQMWIVQLESPLKANLAKISLLSPGKRIVEELEIKRKYAPYMNAHKTLNFIISLPLKAVQKLSSQYTGKKLPKAVRKGLGGILFTGFLWAAFFIVLYQLILIKRYFIMRYQYRKK